MLKYTNLKNSTLRFKVLLLFDSICFVHLFIVFDDKTILNCGVSV